MAERVKMSRSDRAKQFAPFDALKGLHETIKIKEYEHEALPTIQTNRSKNLRKIEECQATIQNLQDKIKELENKKAKEEKLIEEMYQKVKDVKWRLNFFREYEEEHPEYHQLKEDICAAEQAIRDRKNEIYVRKEFIKKLEECISTIEC